MAESKVDTWNQALSRIGETIFIQDESANTPAANLCRLHWDRVVREVIEKHRWAHCTFEATLSRIDNQTALYDGDDATDDFIIPFAFLTPSQITVDLDGVVQVSGTDYTFVDGSGTGSNSYITMTTPPATGEVLTLTFDMSRQGWDYLYGLPFNYVRATAMIWDGVRYDVTAEANRVQFAVLPQDSGEALMVGCNQAVGDFTLEYIGLVDYIPIWPALFHDAVIWRLATELAAGLTKDSNERDRCYQRYQLALSHARAFDSNNKQSRKAQSPSLAARGIGDHDNDWPPYRRPV